MIPHEVIAAHDYTQVTARLIRLLDGNAVAAIILTRISWRLAPLQEGAWWRANYDQIADETGLSARQVRRAIATLVDAGHLELTYEMSAGGWDRTQSYRVLWSDVTTRSDGQTAETVRPNGRMEGTERSHASSGIAGQSDSPNGPDGRLEGTVRSEDPETVRSDVPVLPDIEEQDVETKTARVRAHDPDAVERICTHLADRIEGNTGRRPTVTANWRDAIRLMMDRDHVPENLIMGAITWSQDSEFWRCNILSAPKLREKYMTMKLQAERDRAGRNGHSTTDDRVAQGLRVRDELLAEEAARAADTSRKELTQ